MIKSLRGQVSPTSSSRDDADSGVVCTDNGDTDQQDTGPGGHGGHGGLVRSDSIKHSDLGSRRVYLNHRNITKMKDIKYKRITKTKSKSMEELRDKLRQGGACS